jgi:hypothetical protein
MEKMVETPTDVIETLVQDVEKINEVLKVKKLEQSVKEYINKIRDRLLKKNYDEIAEFEEKNRKAKLHLTTLPLGTNDLGIEEYIVSNFKQIEIGKSFLKHYYK